MSELEEEFAQQLRLALGLLGGGVDVASQIFMGFGLLGIPCVPVPGVLLGGRSLVRLA